MEGSPLGACPGGNRRESLIATWLYRITNPARLTGHARRKRGVGSGSFRYKGPRRTPGNESVLTSKERPNRLQDTRGVEDRYREGSTHLTRCRRKPSLLQNTPYPVGIEGDELSCSRKHGDWKSRQQLGIGPSLLQWLDGETNLFTFYAKRDPTGCRGREKPCRMAIVQGRHEPKGQNEPLHSQHHL